MRHLVVAVLGLALVGAAAARPPGTPPVGVPHGPPPAWVETARAERWLAHGSSCWKTVCADYLPAAKRRDLPVLTVSRGETITFHLAFTPGSARIWVGASSSSVAPARVVKLRVARGGLLMLQATAVGGGDATYLARLRLAP
jgi:hypothetical protein